MKKYRRILAGFLAMNLTISVIPTGSIPVSASESYDREEANTEGGIQAYSGETSVAAYAEDNMVTETSDEGVPSDEANGTGTSETEAPVIEEESIHAEESQTESSGAENLEDGISIIDVEEVTEAQTEATEPINTYAAPAGDLRLEQLKDYDSDTKTLTVRDAKQLTLLSNCDPQSIQEITININISGDLDLTSPNSDIKADDDISAYYQLDTAAGNSADDNQMVNTDGSDAGEAAGGSGVQTPEVQQQVLDENQNTSDASVSDEEPQSGDPEQGDQAAADTTIAQGDIAVQTVTASQDYSFQGIGSKAFPFKGKIEGQVSSVKIDHTFFGGLSSVATVSVVNNTEKNSMELTWCGTGAAPMIAGVYQFDTATSTDNGEDASSNHTLPVTIKGDSTGTMGSLIGTVREAENVTGQVLTIGNVADYSNAQAVNVNTNSDNAGLICNTIESGSVSLNGYRLPTKPYTVKSTASYDASEPKRSAAGNAGGLIGVMKENTALEIKSAAAIQAAITSDNGNAGGLVGLMEQGAKVTTGENEAVTMGESLTVTAGASAGGVAGMATDVVWADTDLVSVIAVNGSTIKSTGSNGITAAAGGFIGKYTLNEKTFSDAAADLSFPNQITITNPVLTVTHNGLAGGYFGQLESIGKLSYTVGGTDANDKKKISLIYQDCQAEAAGAIAGKVTSDNIASTLLIQNVQATVTNFSSNGIQRHGGLVGEVGTKVDANAKAYLKVGNVDVKVTNPYATDEKDKGYGFGGIAGLLAQGSILQTENTVAISTENDTAINRGGGLVGYAEKSVINLSGTTDLSATLYAKDSGKNSNDPKTGWLVGYQDSALIYANGDGNGNGWSYIRGKESGVTKQAMNDIGNYGQIIRLHSNGSSEAEKSKLSSDLITINATSHEISYKQNTAPTVNGNTITLGSTDAFARLSIAWNTRGYFGDVAGIQQDIQQQSKDITLTSDVDLTGSGITGLSRDTYSTDDTYAGTFDGGGYTIILASGETFGLKQDKSGLAEEGADGYGEVISAGASYHGRQGILAEMSTATIQNLIVDGNIWISNNGSNDILVGGIAAELTGTNSKINISGVTVKENVTADSAGGSGLMLGGFFGGSYDSGIEVNLNNLNALNTAAVSISINGCPNEGTNDRRINVGGVIGELGEGSITINVNCLTVGGSIKTDAKKKAYIGGLVGVIKGEYENINHSINISKVVFNNFDIEALNAEEMCGGLFGSVWASVEVVLKTPTVAGKYAVDVQEATIKAPNAASVGGFAYRAGGKWEIQDRGVNLNNFSIKAKQDVGLLVCRGEQAKELLSGGEKQIAALYLSTTKYWENAYKISEANVSVTGVNGVFDEFVAYTTSASWNSTVKVNVSDILKNNKNGIISIATQDVTENEKITRIGVDPSNACTTYQNRTTYGKNKHNKWSRYYYDLDQCLKDIKDDSVYGNNKNLDTPQELLVWSVYTYADNTLKKYFSFSGCGENQIKIGGDSTRANLDMEKYSYYPVTYTGGSVDVQNADIKFHNQEIENIETASSDKKSTQGQTAGDYTQHYTMHCGLFLTYQSVNSSRAGAPLYVNNVTLSGSIGKVNNETSGALVADFAGGYDNMYSAISINNTKLDNLKVNGCGEGYAPLLVNRISLNLNLTVNTISTVNYDTKGTPVASSLIGTVGSTSAENITMNFQNIKLPDKKADGTADGGIFSHATLLESYAYKKDSSTSNATYIFYYKDDWGNGKPHHDNVTYGKEITNSTEFAGIQKWYYDEKLHGVDDGLVYDSADNKLGFDASGYLPYVCVSYDEANCTHEIKVNQRVENILEGCGTYGHPYRITKAAEMNILSEYLSTGFPQKDWRVRVTKNQASVHTSKSDADYSSDEDVVYQYDGNGNWVQVENTATDGTENWQSVNGGKNTLGKDFMLNYLLNAYYDIQGSGSTEKQLILNDFKGLGSESNPFRGVITSSNHTTLVLKGDRTGNGLIPYSYGSVVKNLKISYQKSDENQGKMLTYEINTKSETYPKVAFGGVIGCVMGGDNIIDGVTVEMDDAYLTLSGENSHLLQVGGYVGSVSGGGVIFRNMTDGSGLANGKVAGLSTSSTETDKVFNLYVNPYVGRVLDGFAFYEKTSNAQGALSALENTNKNYKINTLTAGTHLSVNNNAVTVNDNEGLLILSAIVNSGAASGGNSLAYSRFGDSQDTVVSSQDTGRNVTYTFGGKYGKVRNASYSAIGTTSTDATDSIAEDQKLPGESNLPYLIQKYGNKQMAIFSAVTDSTISLSDSASGFDMTNYGNGYQGIGARYVSNAIRGYSSSSPTPVNNPENLVPKVKMFNGNNKTVTVDMQVSEYADDDFPTASVGGIFNVVRVRNNGTLSSVTIKQKANSTSTQTDASSSDGTKTAAGISLAYYNSKGVKADTTCNNKKEVGLGGFAGSLVGYTNGNDNRDITVTSIQTDGLTIDSPASAGGIFGNVGKPAANKNSNIAILLQPQNSQMTYGVAFNNCSYQNLNVTGKYAAGGFAGYIGNIAPDTQYPKSTVNEKAMQAAENIMENSAITATDNTSWAGGLFGYVKTRMFINMTDGGDKKNSTITLQNVAVSAGTAVGGCIGYIDTKRYGIYNVTVKGTNSSKVNISLNSTTTGTFYTGGIVGYAKGGWNDWHPDNWDYVGYIGGSSIENVQINTLDMAGKHDYDNTGEIKTNYITGGIAGQTAGGKTKMEGCTVTSSDIYGSVASGITGQTDSQMEFVGCEIKGTSENSQTNIKGFSTAGGILGFWTGGQIITIQGCKIQYLNAEGKDWGSGAIIGDAKGDGAGILYLFDTSAQDSTVTAAGDKNSGGGRWPCVGTIIGNLRNTIKASNVLVSAVKLDGEDGAKVNNNSTKVSKGLLFGNVNGKTVNIAGISIQNIPDTNSKLDLTGSGTISADTNYIAFADYSGTSVSSSTTSNSQTTDDQESSQISLTGNSNDLLGADYKDQKDQENIIKTDVASPYVVTSPKNEGIWLFENETDADTAKKYLYGDGTSWTTSTTTGADGTTTTTFKTNAQEIFENRKEKNVGHYQYSNILKKPDDVSYDFTFDFSSALSTYNTNQETKAKADFPVVQIGAGSADTVKDYLDIVTNGAFSAANKLNKQGEIHVSARADVYEYKTASDKFVKSASSSSGAFLATTDSSGKITFATTADYDNDKDRFTLLTVTFTEKEADDKTEHHYNVFVPVLVRRMLEIDFVATLTYGTDFRSEDYSNLKTHVLENFGSTITGYLNYIYDSAAGVYTDYGWESYINAGGDIMDMKKSIQFTHGTMLPVGTQLSLVDDRDGKVYYYTATGQENKKTGAEKVGNSSVEIPLSCFNDSDGHAYQEPSISELLGVSAEPATNGLFVEVDASGKPVGSEQTESGTTYGKPTVKIKDGTGGYKYYRLAGSGETGDCKITVPAGNKGTFQENYYLVITVPKTEGASQASMNGSIQTAISSSIPNRVHYRKISGEKGKDGEDIHSNTASTYLLSNGYEQSLQETNISTLSKKISMSDRILNVDVTDTITFPNDQVYNDSDELYLRFVGGLQKTVSKTTSVGQFPSGTAGTASFYVYTMSEGTKTYYSYNSGSWKASKGETAAVTYPWTSDGGNMELPLSADGTTETAISLQGLRKILKGIQTSGKSSFCVEVKMDAVVSSAGLSEIPESATGTDGQPNDYAKLTYTSQLSTELHSLTYSSNRATVPNTMTAYYREEPTGAALTYDADPDKIDQLGINLLDLQNAYLDGEGKNTFINTLATYDLSSMRNLESTLKNSSGIKFTLTLQQKQTGDGTSAEAATETGTTWKEQYQNALTDAQKYLNIELQSAESGKVEYSNGTWTWTVPKTTYYDLENNRLKTNTVFNNGSLTQDILLKVDVANVENLSHVYSNYKVVLTAEVLDGADKRVDGTYLTDYIIYTLAKIKPEFVDASPADSNGGN